MSRRTWRRLIFRVEADLEDYLEVHLQIHLSDLGLDLLVIGRQTELASRGLIDLLAIDAMGVVHIIELKLGRATPAITAQLLAYRRSIKQMTREELIRAAAGNRLRVDLASAFQRRFGLPLPEVVNESQVLIVIAASMHRQTAQSLRDLQESGYSVEALRYIVDSELFHLVRFNLEELDQKLLVATRTTGRRARSAPSTQKPIPGYKVRLDVEWFWFTHASIFVSNLVTVTSAYRMYAVWTRAQGVSSLRPALEMLFARQLAALVVASGEWSRVYLPPGTRVHPLEPLAEPPSMRTHINAGHRIAAYKRTKADVGEQGNRVQR